MAHDPSVLLVFPRFNPNSFWSYKEACEIWGAKAPAPPLGLLTLAGMLPRGWRLRLVDCNVAALTEADLQGADLVLTGGMLPQQPHCLEIIASCRALGVPVAVGGPDPTSSPHVYAGADFRVLGEAEGVLDRFVAAWEAGERSGTFEAPKFQADVTKSPVPRFDLIDVRDYLYVGVQFSRGCPFTCEFCDIIELYGRVPRTKTNEQMLGELETLYRLGKRGHVDFVDDNLIGNKKALKRFLPALIDWQRARNYPFRFSTEASLNLADDDELLDLLRQANFFALFVGIESPDTDTLISTQKKQNTRRSLAASVHKLYEAGMFVTAGFIVGFDSEKLSVSDGMLECIRDTSIPVSMVGLLTALPNTQLTRRLEREGRLHPDYDRPRGGGDQCTAGLNFATLRPRRDIVTDYRAVLAETYRPGAFFERVRVLGRKLDRPTLKRGPGEPAPEPSALVAAVMAAELPATGGTAAPRAAVAASATPIRRRKRLIPRDLTMFGSVLWRMTVKHPTLAPHFLRVFADTARHNPGALEFVVMNMVLYLHLWPFSRFVMRELDRQIAEIDTGRWSEPEPLPKVAPSFATPVAAAPAHALAASA